MAGSDTVDIFNAATGMWSTGNLSQGRWGVGATSVGNYALFAGGNASTGCSKTVDIFTIPEPATLSLLALGGAAVAARRRRKGGSE